MSALVSRALLMAFVVLVVLAILVALPDAPTDPPVLMPVGAP